MGAQVKKTKTKTKRKLTVKQQKFIQFYAGNASQAALKAGYSPKTAPFIGAENLKKPQIVEAIKNRVHDQSKKHILSREERQAFWTETIMSPLAEMKDKLKASELLGRSECDFSEKRILEGGETPVKVDIAGWDD